MNEKSNSFIVPFRWNKHFEALAQSYMPKQYTCFRHFFIAKFEWNRFLKALPQSYAIMILW